VGGGWAGGVASTSRSTAGTSTSPGGPVVPGFQPAVDQRWDLQDQVPQSPVLLGGPLDVGSGSRLPAPCG